MTGQRVVVPGGETGHVEVRAGGFVEVVNTLGGQVVDTWFFSLEDPDEYASMSHSRAAMRTVRPRVGDTFVTRSRRPIVTLRADTSPGVHDMTMPPCDPWRYAQLDARGHRNCADNLRAVLRDTGRRCPDVLPDPLNLFQNSPADADGRIEFRESPAGAGATVRFEAVRDLLVIVSACPMDIMPINGGQPREIELVALDPDEEPR
jgi:hypothetical protein